MNSCSWPFTPITQPYILSLQCLLHHQFTRIPVNANKKSIWIFSRIVYLRSVVSLVRRTNSAFCTKNQVDRSTIESYSSVNNILKEITSRIKMEVESYRRKCHLSAKTSFITMDIEVVSCLTAKLTFVSSIEFRERNMWPIFFIWYLFL